MGTPRKYDAERHPLIARGMAIQGATTAEIAGGLGVNERTVTAWMSAHEEFADAVRSGRDVADAHVVASLYAKARAGDVTACIFWLKNRRPAEWRDRRDMRQEVAVRTDLYADGVDKSDGELIAEAQRLAAILAAR